MKEQTTVWENLCIKIRHKSPGLKINIIGNIYLVISCHACIRS